MHLLRIQRRRNRLWTGRFRVDEDFSEQFITDMVNTREIYLIPMLNTDGVRYDMEEYCGQPLGKIATAAFCERIYETIP